MSQLLAKFATQMRAYSLKDDLDAVKIPSVVIRPKWTNKKLPPPKFEVSVTEGDFEAAKKVLATFNQ